MSSLFYNSLLITMEKIYHMIDKITKFSVACVHC